jgi:CRISPR-associated protein Cas2
VAQVDWQSQRTEFFAHEGFLDLAGAVAFGIATWFSRMASRFLSCRSQARLGEGDSPQFSSADCAKWGQFPGGCVEQAMRNTFLVCYDICDDKRLRRVFKTMRDFGDHLQYSIFECQFTPIDLAKCRHVLSEIIKHNEDQVLFVDLGPTEGRGERVISALGLAYTTLDAPCLVV